MSQNTLRTDRATNFCTKSFSLSLLLLASLFLSSPAWAGKGGGKPGSEDPGVVITIVDDFPAAAVKSDSAPGDIRPYENGVGGVTATINTDVTSDLLFDPDRDAKGKDKKDGTARTLHFELTSLDGQTVHIFNEGAFLNVGSLGVVGNLGQSLDWACVDAQFNLSLGFLRFDSVENGGSGSTVLVESLGGGHWRITASPDFCGGDEAVLIDYPSGDEINRFHVPFQMEVQLQ